MIFRIIRTKRYDFSIGTFAKYAASLHPFLLLWVVTLTWGSLFVVIDQMEHGNKWRKALWIICPVNNWRTWWAHHVAKHCDFAMEFPLPLENRDSNVEKGYNVWIIWWTLFLFLCHCHHWMISDAILFRRMYMLIVYCNTEIQKSLLLTG